MTINFLKKINFSINEGEYKEINDEIFIFTKILRNEIKKNKVKAEFFVGGSFAKNTMMEGNEYDIDIFVRFDKKYKEILSDTLEKIIKNVAKQGKLKYVKLHGSRDYFQIEVRPGLTFEIIPVIKIKNPKDAENTTDLSYFHVNYVKKKLNSNLRREISIAKKFFKSAGVYGAESYIQGFSGYSSECLIIYYKSFEKMIREFSKHKNNKIIIDIENKYKKTNVNVEMNESKTHSPIILIDPTFKERNVTAALSNETFEKLKVKIKEFLRKSDISYFEIKELNENELEREAKTKKAELIHININTDRQEGDIAGTKLKKFSRYIIREINRYFDIIREEFDYKLGKVADIYLIIRSKEEILRQGPPISLFEESNFFRKKNKNVIVKDERLYAKVKIDFTGKEFINKFVKNNIKKMKDMGVINIKVN